MANLRKIIISLLLALVTVLSILPLTPLTASAATAVSYIDRSWDGTQVVQSTQSVTDYTTVASGTTTWSAGWYVVSGDVTISSRVTATGDVKLVLCDGCTLTVSSGILLAKGNSLTIYGQAADTGKLVATTSEEKYSAIGGNSNGDGGTITINGGTVDATGSDGAGIGGGYGGTGGTITINGGTVTAKGNDSAGIGGGDYDSGGTITINGGTVTATSDSGAGIGGGQTAAGGTTTINGGTVDAQSRTGAGIGGGHSESGKGAGGTITINGGTVDATSSYGAGIGGGWQCDGGTITINGGTVDATSTDGAGIGSGYYDRYGFGGTITINGGTVTATSTTGAGIGGGYYSPGGTVTITGGNVKAVGGSGSETIGKGRYGSSSGTLTDGDGNSLSLQTFTLDGVTAQVAVTEVVGAESYGLNDVKTLDTNKLYFYLPSDTSVTALTAGGIEYICYKSNTFYSSHAGFDANGFCENCGTAYQPANLVDGIYQIANAGNLFWLSQQVSSGTVTQFSAVLTADITIPDSQVWTPISVESSTFDGGSHSITFNQSTGLFGTFNYGTVKDLTLYGSVTATSGNVGAVAHSSYRTTFENIISYVNVSTGSGSAGGIVGYFGGKHDTTNGLYSKIINCAVYADISGTNAGGLLGEGWNGTQYFDIYNCAYVGNVTGTTYAGAIVGYQNTDTNTCTFHTVYWCEADGLSFYGYRDTTNQKYTNTEAKTADAFASGEVAYLLGSAWGQNIGTDSYPIPGGKTVYYGYADCHATEKTYNNASSSGESIAHTYENGICANTLADGTVCGLYQEAVLNGDVYEIGNAGQLLWFAEKVNGGERSINGKLTADIDLENCVWTTMCSTGLYYDTTTYSDKGYEGTFDGGGHVIKNFTTQGVSGTKCTVGLFGTLSGTVRNLGVDNMTFELNGATDVRVAAIAGQMLDGSLIENCYAVNSTLTPNNYIVGGIAACNYAGTIKNCFTKNVTISANARCGNLVSDTRGDIGASDRIGTVINCWTDAGRVVGTQSVAAYVTGCYANMTTQFASGEMAYQLNGGSSEGVWKQTVGTDTYPNFAGQTVYKNLDCCSNVAYANEYVAQPDHDYDDDGFCVNTLHDGTVCNGYKEAVLSGDVYQIAIAGNLFWYAQQYNSGAITNDAVLTADITIPDGKVWTPIGTSSMNFAGTFDGGNYTVNLGSQTVTAGNFGIVGYLNGGTVKDLTVEGEISVDAAVEFVSGPVGFATGSATVTGCTSYVNITLTENATGAKNVAGIVGRISAGPAIEKCANYGNITANGAGECIGGITGYANQDCCITDCANYGNVSSDTAQFVGGILGYVNNTSFKGVQNCLNTGTVTGRISVGDIVGCLRNRSAGTILNNYYTGTTGYDYFSDGNGGTADEYPAETATAVKVDADQLKSGEVTYLLNGDQSEIVWKQTCGEGLPALSGLTVYYNQTGGCNENTYTYEYSNTQRHVTTHAWENGACTVCFGVCGTDIDHTLSYSDIEDNTHTETCAYCDYTATVEHSYAKGFCTGCDAYQPCTGEGTAESPYLISNAGQLYWFANQVNTGNRNIHGKLTTDIVVNENVLDDEGNLIEGTYRSWIMIGTNNNYLTGSFDGGGNTVSGLYCDITDTNSYSMPGLVGNVIGGSVKDVGLVDSYIKGWWYAGGVVGSVKDGTVENCWNEATVVGGISAGGVVGSSNSNVTISNCYNKGSITATKNYAAGICVTSGYGITIRNCYNAGTVKGGSGTYPIYSETATAENCYYLADSETDSKDGTTFKTADQFASGEVAYLLNGSTSTPAEGSTLTWYQTIGTDDSPKFSGGTVYKLIPTCNTDTALYSNTNETVGHSYVDGICEYCGTAYPKVETWNLTLDDNILVSFVLENIVETDEVTFTVAGSPVEAVIDGSNYSIALAAAQMTDEIVIYINGKALETTYSVRKYADYILDEANGYDEKTVALVKEMLCYGAAAQTYFAYNTDNLANANVDMTDVGTADVSQIEAQDMALSGSLDGISFYGASLSYRDRIAVRFYFTGDVSGLTFTANGNTYTAVSKDTMYYIEIADILPQDLDQRITLTATDGDGNTITVTYGPMNYIVRMSTKGTENLQTLVKALYNYHLAAKTFVEA